MLKVRRMQTNDIDRVYAIEFSSHRAPWSRDILHNCVLVGYNCLVLEETLDAKPPLIVGYVICRHTFKICHILNLCIDIAHQGRGFGRYLMQELLASLSKNAVSTLMLEVRPSNHTAIVLYESLGFHRDIVKKDYYKDNNGITEDALVLKKQLD